MDSKRGLYLAVFYSNKSSPKWRACYAMTDAEQKAMQDAGISALKTWDEDHAADVANELTAFMVVRAPLHEAAAKLLEGHPHMAIFPCDSVDVMPPLGPRGCDASTMNSLEGKLNGLCGDPT